MPDVLTNRASFTLAAAITSATQVSVTRTSAANGLPGDSNGPASGTYKFVMTDGNGNYEIAQVTGGQGTTTLTIARAVELIGGVQTALASVPSGTVCYAVATASDLTQPGGVYDVLAYGADPTGTNDSTAAIQAAINAAGDGLIWLGNYQLKISSTLTISASGAVMAGVRGRDGGALLPTSTFSGTAAVEVTAASGVTLRDFEVIFVSGTTLTTYGIWTQTAEMVVENIVVKFSPGSSFVIDGPSADVFDAHVIGCTAVLPGYQTANRTSDGFVATQYCNDYLFDRCLVQGGSNVASALLTSSLAANTAYTSLAVSPLTSTAAGALTAGSTILLDTPNLTPGDASTLATCTVATQPATGATSIAIDSFTPTVAFPGGRTAVIAAAEMCTRYGFNGGYNRGEWISCHPYFCYESGGVWGGQAGGGEPIIIGGEWENNGYTNLSVKADQGGLISGINAFGAAAYASVYVANSKGVTMVGCDVDGNVASMAVGFNGCTSCTVTGNTILNGVGPTGNVGLFVNGCITCSITANSIDATLSGSPNSLYAYGNSDCTFWGNTSGSGTSGPSFNSNTGPNPGVGPWAGFYPVAAFGAAGTGTVDDLPAITAAITQCNADGGGWVVLGAGSFAVSDSIVLLQGVNLMGAANFSRVASDHVTTSYIQPLSTFPTTGAPLLQIGALGTGGAATATNPHGAFIRNVGFSGLDNAGTAIAGVIGAAVNDTGEVAFERCVAIDCAGTGIAVTSQTTGSSQGSEGLHFSHCEFLSCGVGLSTTGTGTTDGYVDDCHFNNCSTANFSAGVGNLGGGGYISTGCHYVGNGTTVNNVLAGTEAGPLFFVGCYFDQCLNGASIAGCENLILDGCYYLIDASSTQTTFITVPGANPRVSVSGGSVNLNANTSITSLMQFTGQTGNPPLAQLGNVAIFSGTSGPPSQWLGLYVDSAGTLIQTIGSSVSGTLASNVTLTAGASTLVLTTATLGIGTWLVNAGASVSLAGGADPVSLTLAFGTAAGSFNGPVSDEGYGSTVSFILGLDVCVVATITTAGTLTMSCQCAKGQTVEANDSLYSKAATGYVAVRIA